MTVRSLALFLVCTFATQAAVAEEPQPLLVKPDSSKTWKLDERFTDEFNTDRVDTKKWIKDMKPWGERAWSADNVRQANGSLYIRARYDRHTDRKGNEYFYKLGMLQSRKKTTYGFFEARIKGCSRFPGVSNAFWLYSNGKERNPDWPYVTYCEIDVVEMQQNLYDAELKKKTPIGRIDCNLHCRVMINGKEQWRRPNQWPEVCRHHWDAPWDPRDDYHVYAVENTPERITWYVDGKKVAEEGNLFWHLPMSVALNLELRPPMIDWAGVDGRVPVPEASTEAFCGMSTWPIDFIRFLPSFCFSHSLRFRLMSPP